MSSAGLGPTGPQDEDVEGVSNQFRTLWLGAMTVLFFLFGIVNVEAAKNPFGTGWAWLVAGVCFACSIVCVVLAIVTRED